MFSLLEMALLNRNEEDQLLRGAWRDKVHDQPLRILGHSMAQLFRVKAESWEQVANGVVGLIALGKGVENVHIAFYSLPTSSIILDEPLSKISAYTVCMHVIWQTIYSNLLHSFYIPHTLAYLAVHFSPIYACLHACVQ